MQNRWNHPKPGHVDRSIEADLDRPDHQQDMSCAHRRAYALDPMGNSGQLPPDVLEAPSFPALKSQPDDVDLSRLQRRARRRLGHLLPRLLHIRRTAAD